MERGDRHVFHKLAENSGANFSESGFATLVKRSEHDGQLAGMVGLRLDVPLRLFRELLLRATDAVRARLLALAGPESRDQIQRALAAIAEDAQQEAGFQNEHDYAQAQAALSLLCGAPLPMVEGLFQGERREAFLIPCKAAGLEWPTVRTILTGRSVGRTVSDQDLDSARADYQKLSQRSAQRVLRFWQVRQAASTNLGVQPTPAPTVSGTPKAQISAGR